MGCYEFSSNFQGGNVAGLGVHIFCGECHCTVCMPVMIQPIDHSHNLAVPAMADLCMLECCLDGSLHVLGLL